MSSITDWLKKNHLEFNNQVSKTANYLTIPGNREHMGIGAGTFLGDYYDANFVPVHTDYQQKYVLWNNPATRPRISATWCIRHSTRTRPIRCLSTNPTAAKPCISPSAGKTRAAKKGRTARLKAQLFRRAIKRRDARRRDARPCVPTGGN